MRDNLISGLPLFKRGKIRDIYDLGDRLLMVASDRISCFDVVLPTEILGKGKVLTALSAYWFRIMEDIAPHHLLTTEVRHFPAVCHYYRDKLEGRSMLVKKATPAPVECIVRGYLERILRQGQRLRHLAAEGFSRGLPFSRAPLHSIYQSSGRRAR